MSEGDASDLDTARSIERLLAPKAVAVIGVGRAENSIGRAILRNLVEGGFQGPVYAVNRSASPVGDVPTYSTVLDIPEPFDLAIIAVPAPGVLDVVRQCAEKGVHGAVVISAGFAELAGGAQAQDELVAVARDHGFRIVGPNCFGVLNTNPAIRMNATFSPVAPRPGPIGFASQSGGVGIEVLARAGERGLGISTFVSLGNKADVSGNDLLQYWADDPDTDVVLLYLESFGNPRKFARLAPAIARHKPIIAMKSGRTIAGARAARSHTAALADLDSAVDELLQHSGVIRVDTLEEFLDVATLVAHQPLPRGRRVAVMSNGGGPGILAADACAGAGLDLPELSAGVQERLRAIALPGAGVQNPVDLIAAADSDVFERAARVLLASDEIESLLVLYVAPQVTEPASVQQAVLNAAGAAGAGEVTIAACFLGLDDAVGVLRAGDVEIPTFEFPENAARALGHAADLATWRQRPQGTVPVLDGIDRDRARRLVAGVLARHPDGAWIEFEVAADILSTYGVPVARSRHADTADEAVAAASAAGFPIVLKAAAPTLLHKTDVGGVRFPLGSGTEVRSAFDEMRAALGDAMGGAIVQPLVGPGIELIVGVTRDPTFGPLVLFGMGGFDAELQRDTTLRMPPLTDVDVQESLHALRGSPQLFGFRNADPVDADALGDVLARVGQLADDIDELAELDCNPVIVSTSGAIVVDVKLRLAPAPHR